MIGQKSLGQSFFHLGAGGQTLSQLAHIWRCLSAQSCPAKKIKQKVPQYLSFLYKKYLPRSQHCPLPPGAALSRRRPSRRSRSSAVSPGSSSTRPGRSCPQWRRRPSPKRWRRPAAAGEGARRTSWLPWFFFPRDLVCW